MKTIFQKILIVAFIGFLATGCSKPEPEDSDIPSIYKGLDKPTDRSKDKAF